MGGNRFVVATAVAWTAFCVGLGLFAFRATDGLSAWIFVVLAAHIPAFASVATAEPNTPFRMPRALALAIPASSALAFAAFVVMGIVSFDIWPLSSAPLGFSIGVCVVAFLSTMFLAIRSLTRRPHPIALRRVLVPIAVSGVAALLATLRVGEVTADYPGLWIVVSLPLAFTVPLAAVARRGPRSPVTRGPLGTALGHANETASEAPRT